MHEIVITPTLVANIYIACASYVFYSLYDAVAASILTAGSAAPTMEPTWEPSGSD